MTAQIIEISDRKGFQWRGRHPFGPNDQVTGCECGNYTFHIVEKPEGPPGVGRVQCANCQTLKETIAVIPADFTGEVQSEVQESPTPEAA